MVIRPGPGPRSSAVTVAALLALVMGAGLVILAGVLIVLSVRAPERLGEPLLTALVSEAVMAIVGLAVVYLGVGLWKQKFRLDGFAVP